MSTRSRSNVESSPKRSRAKGAPEAQPVPPFPAQHQERPGLKSAMSPAPRFEAPHYRESGKLKGLVALITGGDSGIGRAAAVLLAREGADVAIVYLPEEESDAEVTAEAVRNVGRRVLHLPGDVRDPTFCATAIERTVADLGRLDILVNNAAYQQHQESLLDIDDAQLHRTVETNVYGYFYMTRAALPHLPRGGSIINTGSITGLEGSGGLVDYAATKGAINAFTKSLAQQLVTRGIRVNCVAPGPVWTPLNVADKSAEEAAKHGQDTPMKRPAQPEEIAPAYVFFASAADSGYITGEVLTLTGGEPPAA